MKKLFKISSIFIPPLFVLAACGGSNDKAKSAMSNEASLSVSMKVNAQYPISSDRLTRFDKVFLKVGSIKVLSADKSGTVESEWIDVEMPKSIRGRPVDFVPFTQSSINLASGSVAPGAYKKIRLIFSPNQVADSYRNYVNLTKENPDTRIRTTQEALIDFSSDASRTLEMPLSFSVGRGSSTSIGITLDLRSIFEKTEGNFVFAPVATAFDEKNAGSITVDLGPNDGSVMVTVQRDGKIVRRIAAPASATSGVLTLDQLPKTPDAGEPKEFYENPANSYQVVLFSPAYTTKIIKNIPVKAGKSTKASSTVVLLNSPPLLPDAGLIWLAPGDRTASGGAVIGPPLAFTAEARQALGPVHANMAVLLDFTPAIFYRSFLKRNIFTFRAFVQIPLNPEILDYAGSDNFQSINSISSQFFVKLDSGLASEAEVAETSVLSKNREYFDADRED